MMKERNVKVIWDGDPNFEDWVSDLKDEYPEHAEDENYLRQRMYEVNGDYLDDERERTSQASSCRTES